MEYSKIVSISGMNGLYELLSSKTDGAIVRSLDDNSTRFVASRMHNFSHLETIEVYTVKDNVNLSDIFNAMKASDDVLPDAKNAVAVKKYFQSVYPTIDFDRVYMSDMKKMVKWFDLLRNKVEFILPDPAATTEALNEQEQPVENQAIEDADASQQLPGIKN